LCLTTAGEVHRGVEVTIRLVAAFAGEHAIRQLQFALSGAASPTDLARRVPAVSFDERGTVPSRLVDELSSEFGPACVADGLCKATVPHHAGNVEVFQYESVVSLDEFVGDRM
jgi:hypothetical protein